MIRLKEGRNKGYYLLIYILNADKESCILYFTNGCALYLRYGVYLTQHRLLKLIDKFPFTRPWPVVDSYYHIEISTRNEYEIVEPTSTSCCWRLPPKPTLSNAGESPPSCEVMLEAAEDKYKPTEDVSDGSGDRQQWQQSWVAQLVILLLWQQWHGLHRGRCVPGRR